MRIVSLIPSASEIVALLGADHMLVGRSHECDFPAAVRSAAVLTAQSTRFDPSADPASDPRADPRAGHAARDINQQVISATESGVSLYRLDAEKLAQLAPDLIITQDLCGVCSIDLQTVRSIAGSLPNAPEILTLNPGSIEDILDDIYRVGEAIDRADPARPGSPATTYADRAMHEAVRLSQRMDRALGHVNPYDDGDVCGFMEWTDPIYIAGHWNVQLIERAGARHPLNETVPRPHSGAAVGPQQAQRIAGHSIAVPPQVFSAARPKRLLIAPCGVPLDQALIETNRLFADTDWFSTLPAVRENTPDDPRVAVVDGSQMFNRPGPRVADALEFLVGWINRRAHLIPEGFPWKAWSPPAQ